MRSTCRRCRRGRVRANRVTSGRASAVVRSAPWPADGLRPRPVAPTWYRSSAAPAALEAAWHGTRVPWRRHTATIQRRPRSICTRSPAGAAESARVRVAAVGSAGRAGALVWTSTIGAMRHCRLMMALSRAGQVRTRERHLRHRDVDDPISSLLELRDQFGNRVDLLVGLRGLEDAAFTRAIEVAFEGEKLRVVSRGASA